MVWQVRLGAYHRNRRFIATLAQLDGQFARGIARPDDQNSRAHAPVPSSSSKSFLVLFSKKNFFLKIRRKNSYLVAVAPLTAIRWGMHGGVATLCAEGWSNCRACPILHRPTSIRARSAMRWAAS
jgi:hypothetical protein